MDTLVYEAMDKLSQIELAPRQHGYVLAFQLSPEALHASTYERYNLSELLEEDEDPFKFASLQTFYPQPLTSHDHNFSDDECQDIALLVEPAKGVRSVRFLMWWRKEDGGAHVEWTLLMRDEPTPADKAELVSKFERVFARMSSAPKWTPLSRDELTVIAFGKRTYENLMEQDELEFKEKATLEEVRAKFALNRIIPKGLHNAPETLKVACWDLGCTDSSLCIDGWS